MDEPYATPDGVWIDASTIDGINEWLAQARLGSGPLGLRLVKNPHPPARHPSLASSGGAQGDHTFQIGPRSLAARH